MTISTPQIDLSKQPKIAVAGDFSLRYLLEILFRRKRIFLLPMILTPLLAVLASLVIKAEYLSSTTILLGKDEILNPLVRYETAVAMIDTNRLGSFQKIINSRPLLEETIRKLGLDKTLKSDLDMEMLVNRLRTNTHVFGLTSDSFQIAYTAPNPVLAKNTVETISHLFIDKSLQGSRREAMAAVNLIQQEVDHYRRERDQIDQALQQFRMTHMETLGQINTLGGQLNEYRTKELDSELELKQERLNENLLTARLTGEKPMVVAQALYLQNTPYQRHYQELQLQMSKLLSTRDKSHPEVLKLQREMDYILRLLDDEKTKNEASETQEVRSPVYQEVSARLEDSRIKIKILEQKIAEYQRLQEEARKKLAQVPELEKEQARMLSEVKLTNELYDTLRVKLEQARITSEVEIAQQSNRFTIIDPPVVPLTRHRPKRRPFVIGGILGGISLGLLLAFLLEFTDPRLVRPGDLFRQARLRVVGVVPKLYQPGQAEPFQHLVRPLRLVLGAIFCARRFVLPLDVPPNLVIGKACMARSCPGDPSMKEALDDYLKRIRSIAMVARDSFHGSDRLLWMVTSARNGEGKSLLIANLGTVLSRDLKKPVLLVDGNLENPSLSQTLGLKNSPGLSDCVEGRVSLEEALVSLDTPGGLTLLPAGTPVEYPDELYNDPGFYRLLERLREQFSFTIVEAPEMLEGTGGMLIAPHADGILFVAKLYQAKRKAVEAALQRLPAEKIIGVVFNYFEYWIPEWLYRWV